MEIKLVRANVDDAETIWKMQIKAFTELLQRYQDYETSPANESLEKVQGRLQMESTYFYFIQMDGENVGAIRVVDAKEPDSKKRISPLFILPQFRNKGIAQLAIKEAEKIHGSNKWNLSTILQEQGNCYLYEKMGYRRTGKTEVINDKMTLVFYEKE